MIKCNSFYNFIFTFLGVIFLGVNWIKISTLYFIFGIGLGMFMSSTIQLHWAAAHAHINLVGWVSGAIIGLIYCVFPNTGNNKLGKFSFWLYTLGLPLFLLSTFLVQIPSTVGFAHTFTFTGGSALAFGVILFTINVFINLKNEKTTE